MSRDVGLRSLRPLGALQHAISNLQLHADEGIEPLLQSSVDTGRHLLSATFGGILLTNADDTDTDRWFKVSGWTGARALRPRGEGLYIYPLKSGQSLRVDDVRTHPLSVGIPSDHPPIGSLLTVPLCTSGQPAGCMFFSNPPGQGIFTESDEELANAYASACALTLTMFGVQDSIKEAARIAERQAIANQLHDSVSQSLFALTRDLEQICRRRTSATRSVPSAALKRVWQHAAIAQSSLRATLFRMNQHRASGRDADLARLVAEFTRDSSVRTELFVHGDSTRIAAPLRQTLFNIVSESLSNVVRHAQSRHAMVQVCVDNESVTVSVQDAGIGITDEAIGMIDYSVSHFGLYSMTAAAREAGGQFEIFRNEDGGTTVRCSLPLLTPSAESRKEAVK